MIIASFDIGKHNFSVYVEKFSLEELKSLPGSSQTPTAISLIGKRLFWKNVSLIGDVPLDTYKVRKEGGKIRLSNQHYDNMYAFLDSNARIWDRVDRVIIEEQYKNSKGKQNTDCIKLAQHCHSYFFCKYRKCNPEYIPSTYKTQKLDAPKIGLRKKASIAETNYNTSELKKFTLKQLKTYMKETGIKGVTGGKKELVRRIREYHNVSGDNKITTFDSNTLASYDIKTLRQYLTDNNITKTARTKEQVMKIIQEHNGVSEDIVVTSTNRGTAIKQWSIVQATKMMTQRGDDKALKILSLHRKKDDLADTFNQLQAYKMTLIGK